ncbi:MAG: transposase [Bacillota bacterium]
MPDSHPPYPAEFRARAVELVRTSDKPIPEIAREQGISGEELRGWVRQAEADAGRGRPGVGRRWFSSLFLSSITQLYFTHTRFCQL